MYVFVMSATTTSGVVRRLTKHTLEGVVGQGGSLCSWSAPLGVGLLTTTVGLSLVCVVDWNLGQAVALSWL